MNSDRMSHQPQPESCHRLILGNQTQLRIRRFVLENFGVQKLCGRIADDTNITERRRAAHHDSADILVCR